MKKRVAKFFKKNEIILRHVFKTLKRNNLMLLFFLDGEVVKV